MRGNKILWSLIVMGVLHCGVKAEGGEKINMGSVPKFPVPKFPLQGGVKAAGEKINMVSVPTFYPTFYGITSTSDTLPSLIENEGKNTIRLIAIETAGGIVLGSISALGTLYLTWPRENGTSSSGGNGTGIGEAGEEFGKILLSGGLSTFAYLFSSALGVYTTGKLLNQRGAFWDSLKGSFLIGIVGGLLGGIISEYTESPLPGVISVGIGCPLGASLYYNKVLPIVE